MLLATPHRLLLGLLGLAALTDLAWRRVPNPLLLLGLLLVLPVAARAGWGQALAGLAVGGGLLLLPYARGWIGAGDVKLAALIGAWLGPLGVLSALLWSAVAGGALALAYLFAYRGRPKPMLPYAVAMALGTAAALRPLGG